MSAAAMPPVTRSDLIARRRQVGSKNSVRIAESFRVLFRFGSIVTRRLIVAAGRIPPEAVHLPELAPKLGTLGGSRINLQRWHQP
jgi:hypothetical protein